MNELRESLRESLHQHWWLSPLAVALAIGLCVGAGSLAKPRYLQWRSARALAQARRLLDSQDLKRAGVALQVALRGRPTLEGYELLADFDEACGSNEAITARKLAVQLWPNDLRLKLNLVRTALRFSDLSAAREALGAIKPKDRLSLEYRRVDATYALLAGEWGRAGQLLAALRRENPSDSGIRLLDDSLNLRNEDERIAGRARADLRDFSGDSTQQLTALRALLGDAVRRGQTFAAAETGRTLAATPGATFADLLDAASAETLGLAGGGADAALLAKIRAQAGVNSSAAARYGRWLLFERRPDQAAEWIRELPPSLIATPAIAELQTEVATARADWNGLRRLLEQGAWGPITNSSLDLGFAARILRRDQPGLATDTWAEALRESAASEFSLRSLARLADVWHWPDGMQAALVAAARSYPDDQVTAQYLIGLLHARHDTRGFRDFLTLRKAAVPLTDRQLADWALVSLLVSPRTKPDEVTDLLASLDTKHPADPYIVTDHAFALWQLGKIREARASIDRLDSNDRANPARAPYLAIIYAAAGNTAEAQATLIRAPKSSELWPEEAQLVARAAAMVNR